ncbi:hypothetical protein N7534_008788, partial [Penicillium rubens]
LYIAPRISSDTSILYVDAKDIILHLKTIFANLNRRIEAYTVYYKLKIKPKDSFTNFLIDSPKKLSLLPKTISVIYIRNSRSKDLLTYPIYDPRYRCRRYIRRELVKHSPRKARVHSKYITYNYPKKKPTLAIATTTPTINPPRIDEIIELKANTDSGKVPTRLFSILALGDTRVDSYIFINSSIVILLGKRFGLRVERLGRKYPRKIVRNIKDEILNVPLSYKKEDKPPLPVIDISAIRREVRKKRNPIGGIEIFTTSLSEIDRILTIKSSIEEDLKLREIKKILPLEYHDLAEVFLKKKLDKLPLYRPGVDHDIILKAEA